MTDRRVDCGPLDGNPLRSREDVQRAVRDCYSALLPHVSPGGARLRLAGFAATYPREVAELEAFARPLWGLAPLAAGGGSFPHWELIRNGIVAGSDPRHEEFWGWPGSGDQRMVEMAAIAVSLLLTPHETWEPLPARARATVGAWLSSIDDHEPLDNNWLWFRVLVDLGLRRVGARTRPAPAAVGDLDRIDSFYLSEGWYADGAAGACDWYVAFVFHVYGLLYAASGLGDPDRAAVFRRRAVEFAGQLVHWYAPSGAALGFGRSLTYRFAQSAFWAALALADVEALPWGQVKGLYLRSLRHWSRLPIWERDGVLSIGYCYDNRRLAERYTSAASPYWSFKGFLALAVAADHPFWTSDEEPLPATATPVVQVHPGMALSHDGDQVLAVSCRQGPLAHIGDGAAKYARLAYSSRFGLCLDLDAGERGIVSDSTLVLEDESGERRLRDRGDDFAVDGSMLACRWSAWPDVEVDTVLWISAPWHVRLHRIGTGRRLTAVESGFGLGFEPVGEDRGLDVESRAGFAVASSPAGRSGILDASGRPREGAVWRTAPNASITWPRTVIPVLHTALDPGTHDLACLVLAAAPEGAAAWSSPPRIPEAAYRFLAARTVTRARRRPWRRRLVHW